MRATTGSRQESLVLKGNRRAQPTRRSRDEESGSGPIAVPKSIVTSCLTAKSDRSSGRVYQTELMRVSEVEQGLNQKRSAKLETKKIFPGILRRGRFEGWYELFYGRIRPLSTNSGTLKLTIFVFRSKFGSNSITVEQFRSASSECGRRRKRENCPLKAGEPGHYWSGSHKGKKSEGSLGG
jgi:hypothetical protein